MMDLFDKLRALFAGTAEEGRVSGNSPSDLAVGAVAMPANTLWSTLFERHSEEADLILEEALAAAIGQAEQRTAAAYKTLLEVRRLLNPRGGRGKRAVREAFLYTRPGRRAEDSEIALFPEDLSFHNVSVQDVMEASLSVSHLYWRLLDLCTNAEPALKVHARRLFASCSGTPFEERSARAYVESVSDAMLREHGVTFLMLNLLRRKQLGAARTLGQTLLASATEVEPELASALYWLAEVTWFSETLQRSDTNPVRDHESTLRYLYHLCFLAPDRAGFLEIDSPFFGEFSALNGMAQEGFLFAETLVEKFLEVWKENPEFFGPVFQGVLRSMTRGSSKIIDDLPAWERFWAREQEDFGKEYLLIVEGNLSYAAGNYEDAEMFYEKALKLNPEMRSARLNLLFVYARTNQSEKHERQVERVLEGQSRDLYPTVLHHVANSYLILGKEGHANVYYSELAEVPGWGKKTEYYRSTFCFEQGLFESALKHAQTACEKNPQDTSMRYHYALCLAASNRKPEALAVVKTLSDMPEWVSFYRFTLERDTGLEADARATLLGISPEYFEDPDELAAAREFAKQQQDLTLLRRFKR